MGLKFYKSIGGGKMVTLDEVLSSATPQGSIMRKVWFWWVFRLLENAAIVYLKMLRDIDAHNKPQSPCAFMQITLYIILLTQNSIPSKIAFPWSH